MNYDNNGYIVGMNEFNSYNTLIDQFVDYDYAPIVEEPFEQLKAIKEKWHKQQLRAALHFPPYEPDSYHLEDKFKEYFEQNWGNWDESKSNFNLGGAKEMDFLKNCVLLQWKIEDPMYNHDKTPLKMDADDGKKIFISGIKSTRTYKPSLQACILGLDPTLLHSATFEADVKLQDRRPAFHALILTEKEGSIRRADRKPIIEFLEDQPDDIPIVSPQNYRVTPKLQTPVYGLKRARTASPIKERPKRKHIVIHCSWSNLTQNNFNDPDMRGCQNCTQDDYHYHCIKANFFQIGLVKLDTGTKQNHDTLSVIEVTITLRFHNGDKIVLFNETHPFIVAPGKENKKDSIMFLKLAWYILTESPSLDVTELETRKLKWKELREFFRLAFKAQKTDVRLLDKQELLLLQCKLFMNRLTRGKLPGINYVFSWRNEFNVTKYRDELLRHFINDEELIAFSDLLETDETSNKAENSSSIQPLISIVDLRTRIKQGVWVWMSKAFETITYNYVCTSNDTRKTNCDLSNDTRKMIDLFNKRFITLISFQMVNRIFTSIKRKLKVGEEYNETRALMLRFDDDNADVCCTYYMNIYDPGEPELVSHTPLREILRADGGGFSNFMNYEFSKKFNCIICLVPKPCFNEGKYQFHQGSVEENRFQKPISKSISENASLHQNSIESYSIKFEKITDIFGPQKDVPQEIFISAGRYEVFAKTGQRRAMQDIDDAASLSSGIEDYCSIKS